MEGYSAATIHSSLLILLQYFTYILNGEAAEARYQIIHMLGLIEQLEEVMSLKFSTYTKVLLSLHFYNIQLLLFYLPILPILLIANLLLLKIIRHFATYSILKASVPIVTV